MTGRRVPTLAAAEEIKREAEGRLPVILDDLEAMVELETPTGDASGMTRFAEYLLDRVGSVAASIEKLPGGIQGDHLRCEFGRGDEQILVLSHMDTVWPLGTVANWPFTVEGDRAYGPGTADMKGGLAVALHAIELLLETKLLSQQRVVWLITTDEEVGSPSSRPLIEAEAKRSGRVLVTEPGDPERGAVKTRRKGTGAFDIRVRGVASHSGAAHAEGASATSELARQIARIDSWTDYAVGTTLNIGEIGGGQARNVVADSAWASVDVRVEEPGAAKHIESALRNLAPIDGRTTIEVSGSITRPPMSRPPCVARTYDLAVECARALGLELPEVSSGGASDANFTAALGVPTLDGLGVVGGGMHSSGEYIVVPSLPSRTALLAMLLTAPIQVAKA
ncbi:MAG TPA: M20 family metallopeptidase [Trueperaceae bacterium]